MTELLFEPAENGSPDRRPMPHLTHLTCEFRILLHLRLNPGSSNGQIVAAIGASPTTFHRAINLLLEMGLLQREICGADRRRTRYFLPQATIQAIDRAADKFFAWLDDATPPPEALAPEPGPDRARQLPPGPR